MFVIICIWLQKCFGISLPGVSLMFHVITTILTAAMSLLSIAFFFPKVNSTAASGVSIWAVIIYSFCPIVSFSSQKVWIDNCAVATATFSAVIHLAVAIRCRKIIASSLPTAWPIIIAQLSALHMISGFIFGVFALNTKISNLALLPFLLGVSALASAGHKHEEKNQRSLKNICITAIVCICSFAAGVSLGHGPWMYYYWVRHFAVLLLACQSYNAFLNYFPAIYRTNAAECMAVCDHAREFCIR